MLEITYLTTSEGKGFISIYSECVCWCVYKSNEKLGTDFLNTGADLFAETNFAFFAISYPF